MSVVAVRVLVHGRVQGVWFRAWTVQEATRRGLRGWVRNRRDGAVEALFVGAAAPVEAMVAASHQGPPAARVDRVERFAAQDDGAAGFAQRPTE